MEDLTWMHDKEKKIFDELLCKRKFRYVLSAQNRTESCS